MANTKLPSSKAAAAFSVDDFAQALEAQGFDFQPGQVVSGRVVEHDSNGAFVDIGAKSPGFLPLQEIPAPSREDLTTLLPVGTEEEFLIIRDQDNEGQVRLSRRKLRVKRLWGELAQMQNQSHSLAVRVTGVNRGGVLVNLQGLRGFVPRSQLLAPPADLQELVGQTITVGLLQVTPEANKLVLSQRLVAQAESFPNLEPGQLVEGTISGIKPFGLFIRFDEGMGLLHIKQISQKFIASLTDHFKEGQPIKAIILEVDPQKGRISLGTRTLEKYPGEILEQFDTVMAEAAVRAGKLKGKLLQEA